MKTILDKLEEIKQLGNYSVTLYYGEDIGCDDLDIPQNDRKIIILAVPVGYVGEVRILYRGSVSSVLAFDFSSEPRKLNNPPKREDYSKEGYYAWGTDGTINDFYKAIRSK